MLGMQVVVGLNLGEMHAVIYFLLTCLTSATSTKLGLHVMRRSVLLCIVVNCTGPWVWVYIFL